MASENIRSVNSILPLLRKNARSSSMRNHCSEYTKNAADLLNPGQVIIDLSDQLIYSILRILLQYLPNELGHGLFLPMFGWLHIEKLLLKTQGKMVDGNCLLKVLNVSHNSMTWAGNIIIKVPRITSAWYLLQMCLCAEFKICGMWMAVASQI